jgi:hypothetical protein
MVSIAKVKKIKNLKPVYCTQIPKKLSSSEVWEMIRKIKFNLNNPAKRHLAFFPLNIFYTILSSKPLNLFHHFLEISGKSKSFWLLR